MPIHCFQSQVLSTIFSLHIVNLKQKDSHNNHTFFMVELFIFASFGIFIHSILPFLCSHANLLGSILSLQYQNIQYIHCPQLLVAKYRASFKVISFSILGERTHYGAFKFIFSINEKFPTVFKAWQAVGDPTALDEGIDHNDISTQRLILD